MENYVGKHWLVDLITLDKFLLEKVDLVQEKILEVAKKSSLNILKTAFHQFEPEGVTGILLLTESHLSIHTWPEKNLVTLDLFSCNDDFDFESFLELLKDTFKANEINFSETKRGFTKKTETNFVR
ncbi:MAG: adenosylmethionine decarboxylase [Calditrichaeota bacterium]|nr:MAG: adenosylmethionine decarboxylase [Calditrichota bacterium]